MGPGDREAAPGTQTEDVMKNKCDGCGGACCYGQESPPGLAAYLPGGVFEGEDCDDARRVREMPQSLRDELTNYMRCLLADIRPPHPQHPDCLWLDKASGKCKHHEWRPDLCREFRAGSAACRRRKEQLAAMTVNGKRLVRSTGSAPWNADGGCDGKEGESRLGGDRR